VTSVAPGTIAASSTNPAAITTMPACSEVRPNRCAKGCDMRAIAERYSDEELAVVSRFLRDAYAVSVDHVARLQRQ
jgi:hypothetical protein